MYPPIALTRLHIFAGLLQTGCPRIVIINNPVGKTDRTVDRQSRIAIRFFKSLETTALFGEALQITDPRLDAVVTRLGGNFDLFHDREFLTANRTDVQTNRTGSDPADASAAWA